jgi:hypothetical protein
MDFNFDPTLLMLSLIPSGIGFVLFTYGKKQQRIPHLVAGIAMMVYPYATNTALSMLGVGAVICGVLYLMVSNGW